MVGLMHCLECPMLENYKGINSWIKQVDFPFDAESYETFYKSGKHSSYMPELYDYTESNGIGTIKMEIIEGQKIDRRWDDIVLRFCAYRLIPEWIEWSSLRSETHIYTHNDLKLDNFVMASGRLVLLDIDSWAWSKSFPSKIDYD